MAKNEATAASRVEVLATQVAYLRRQLEWVREKIGPLDRPLAMAVEVILRDPAGGGDGR